MNERAHLPRRLLIAATLLIAVVGAGTIGYAALERWSWFDALYMTVTTITTVGGGEPPGAVLDVPGKVWTIIVVAFGFGALTYTVLAGFGFIIEGHLGAEFSQRRMRTRVARMRDHFILCGFGRVGREIARDFTTEKIAFVVIDINADSLERAAAEGFTVVSGNAADVATLQAAGIDRARGLVTAVDHDADNIYVTLSARVLKPELFIVARANAEDAERKLRLAGANRVISPYTIGGRRMASLATRPTAVEFVDTVLSADNGSAAARGHRDQTCVGMDRTPAGRAVPRRRRSVRPGTQARGRDALSAGPRNAARSRRRAGRSRSARSDPRARRTLVRLRLWIPPWQCDLTVERDVRDGKDRVRERIFEPRCPADRRAGQLQTHAHRDQCDQQHGEECPWIPARRSQDDR